jgi:hypothetical protein
VHPEILYTALSGSEMTPEVSVIEARFAWGRLAVV